MEGIPDKNNNLRHGYKFSAQNLEQKNLKSESKPKGRERKGKRVKTIKA